jgi:hypothetical protein
MVLDIPLYLQLSFFDGLVLHPPYCFIKHVLDGLLLLTEALWVIWETKESGDETQKMEEQTKRVKL